MVRIRAPPDTLQLQPATDSTCSRSLILVYDDFSRELLDRYRCSPPHRGWSSTSPKTYTPDFRIGSQIRYCKMSHVNLDYFIPIVLRIVSFTVFTSNNSSAILRLSTPILSTSVGCSMRYCILATRSARRNDGPTQSHILKYSFRRALVI